MNIEKAGKLLQNLRIELAKRIVGQEAMVDGLLIALLAGGHVLLEGVPGLAKTLAVKTLAAISKLSFKRIQFTPDLLPADLTGTLVWEQGESRFSVRKGPVFTQLLLADEINRAPAKVQSALLEAMEERQVTIGEKTYPLPAPFFVLATQNPLDQEGTYALPEAELDRFLFKLLVDYPSFEEEISILSNSAERPIEEVPVRQLLTAQDLEELSRLAHSVHCDKRIFNYIVSLVAASRPPEGADRREGIYRYIHFGASPRASIAILRVAKVRALFEGRDYVLPEDVKAMTPAVLRHRLVLSYEAEADEKDADAIIQSILDHIAVP